MTSGDGDSQYLGTEAELLSAVQSSPDGVCIADADWIVLYANPACSRLRGNETGRGTRVGDLFRDVMGSWDERNIRRTVGEGSTWTVSLLGAQGGLEPASVPSRLTSLTVTMFRTGEGEQRFLFTERVIGQDVQSWRQLEESRKLDALRRIAGGIAHDINNLLWTIAGSAEIALDEIPEGVVLHRDVQRILKAAQLGKHLVNQVSFLASSGPGKCERVSLTAVVEEAAGLVQATLPPSVRFQWEVLAREPGVMGDRDQLVQMLVSLCKNASQAIRATGGAIDVVVSEPEGESGPAQGRWLEVKVEDNGRGMGPQLSQRVFDPFFSMKPSGVGVGIGLTVARQIANDHGGSMTVASEAGRGTVVRILLPASGPAGSKGVKRTVEGRKPEGRGRAKVLVVSGQVEQLDMMTRQLTRPGNHVVTASRLDRALALLEPDGRGIDLAVVDADSLIGSLSVAGLGRIARLIGDRAFLVLLTSDPDADDRTLELGRRGTVLRKPLRTGELVLAAQRALQLGEGDLGPDTW